jgi:plastocyanin
MKRRDLLTSMVASGLAVPAFAAQGHEHRPVNGPMATATVSFGNWPIPSNRFAVPNAPAAPNGHQLIPNEVTIKVGGTVNFIVAGFHLITVYGPDVDDAQINVDALVPGSDPPGFIDDPNGRIYFGVDPRTVAQDRVEVVSFPQRGRYLVICAVHPHFVNDHMYGWVRVLP